MLLPLQQNRVLLESILDKSDRRCVLMWPGQIAFMQTARVSDLVRGLDERLSGSWFRPGPIDEQPILDPRRVPVKCFYFTRSLSPLLHTQVGGGGRNWNRNSPSTVSQRMRIGIRCVSRLGPGVYVNVPAILNVRTTKVDRDF
jgi:hypothetical protein